MNTVSVDSFPKLAFSHVHRANTYHNRFALNSRFLEVSYIADGEVTICRDGETFRAGKGDVLCFFYDTDMQITAESFHCHHTVGISLSWSVLEDKSDGLLIPQILSGSDNTAEICRIIDDCIRNQVYYRTSLMQGAAKILELLCAIDKRSRKNQNKNLPGEKLYAQRAKKYIQQNVHAPLTQKTIAEHLGISSEYLCTVFKKAEGMTVMRYINTIKLDSIKSMMDNTNIRLYEAAAMYGYSDPNYVSRLYKQLFGYSITDTPSGRPEGESLL
jgi:AraC-like DNA-binding protein